MCLSLDKSSAGESFLGSHDILLIVSPDICLKGSMHLSVSRWEDSGAMICQVCFPCFAGQYVSFFISAKISVPRCTHQYLSSDCFL